MPEIRVLAFGNVREKGQFKNESLALCYQIYRHDSVEGFKDVFHSLNEIPP